MVEETSYGLFDSVAVDGTACATLAEARAAAERGRHERAGEEETRRAERAASLDAAGAWAAGEHPAAEIDASFYVEYSYRVIEAEDVVDADRQVYRAGNEGSFVPLV